MAPDSSVLQEAEANSRGTREIALVVVVAGSRSSKQVRLVPGFCARGLGSVVLGMLASCACSKRWVN